MRHPWRRKRFTSTAGLWMAAARGACVDGDHAAERRYRNAARLIRHRPPLTDKARCLVGKTRSQ